MEIHAEILKALDRTLSTVEKDIDRAIHQVKAIKAAAPDPAPLAKSLLDIRQKMRAHAKHLAAATSAKGPLSKRREALAKKIGHLALEIQHLLRAPQPTGRSAATKAIELKEKGQAPKALVGQAVKYAEQVKKLGGPNLDLMVCATLLAELALVMVKIYRKR
jgi:hypothetical protein